MAMKRRKAHSLLPLVTLLLSFASLNYVSAANCPVGRPTKFYDFKVQIMRIKKLCKSKDIVTINGMFPGPVIYAQEDDTVIVNVTNETPHNATIHWQSALQERADCLHMFVGNAYKWKSDYLNLVAVQSDYWHGVRQRMSCWFDGPSYITQCPIQAGQSFTYKFTLVQQKGTLFWHAHVSWLRGTVNGAIVIYPKNVLYPFPCPYEEQIIILGEYWYKDLIQLENQVLASGGAPPRADAYVINGQPGPLYNCSSNDVYKIKVVPGKTYLLRIINAALNTENFFSIANHKLTVVEADGEYTKPFMVDHIMITPGQTMNVLVTANQCTGRYYMAMGPYTSARNISFQNISAVAYFQYISASTNSVAFSAQLPRFNDNLIVKSNMDYLKSLDKHNVPLEIDENLFFTVGLNVLRCNSSTPNKSCQGPNRGILAASMNNITFLRPKLSLLQAYYNKIHGYFTDDFPDAPLKTYDFVYGAPNNSPNNTQSIIGTKVKVLEYGSRVQLIFQDTGTVSTENHPIHLHGYSFYVIGFGSGNYNPRTAVFNLVDPPYMNTIGVPVGGWAAIRFVADNPGVWFMHCHLEVHMSWGLSMAFIVKNGKGPLETLPHPPADIPSC